MLRVADADARRHRRTRTYCGGPRDLCPYQGPCTYEDIDDARLCGRIARPISGVLTLHARTETGSRSRLKNELQGSPSIIQASRSFVERFSHDQQYRRIVTRCDKLTRRQLSRICSACIETAMHPVKSLSTGLLRNRLAIGTWVGSCEIHTPLCISKHRFALSHRK